jgi:hypothetical protein
MHAALDRREEKGRVRSVPFYFLLFLPSIAVAGREKLPSNDKWVNDKVFESKRRQGEYTTKKYITIAGIPREAQHQKIHGQSER